MDRGFWLARWKDHQIGFHQQEVNAALRAHWQGIGVPAGARVFVPLCGKSRDMLWLRAQGHPVVGVELSRIAVQEFFAENGLAPTVSTDARFERWEAEGVTLLCGDLFDLTPSDLEGVRGVYDRASLIALPPAMRRRYADKMREALPAQAATLLITLSDPTGKLEGPPFSVTPDEVHALYGPTNVALLATGEGPALRDRPGSTLTEHVFRVISKTQRSR